jgi:hypothetical protein
MIKKLSIFVFFVAIMCSVVTAQVTPPTLATGEYWTNMWSLSYDYQTNGSVRYIVQDPATPSNLLAIFMGTHDSSSAAGTNRYVWYSYSTNGGRTWEASSVTTTNFAGFPCLAVSSSGTPYVGMHMTASPTRGFLWSDAIFGAGSWSEVGVIPQTPVLTVWPHIAVTTNGNVVFAACPNPGFQGHYNTWNGTTWFANQIELPNSGGPSGNFSVEAGPSGKAFIFGCDYNGDLSSKLFTSTDNGLTFALQSGANAPPAFLFSGADTIVNDIAGGKDGIYVGNDLHLVYAIYGSGSVTLATPPNTNLYYHAKIVHWSAATGIDTIAGRFNIPNFADTITQVNMTPLCHPSIGIYNGIMYCAFTAYIRGNKQLVDDGSSVNAGEIYISWSVDNGNTWTTPTNLTNTPSLEEKHPSVMRTWTKPTPSDTLGISYIRDMKAGSWVNVAGWGQAPVYSLYRKLNPAIFPIGIKQDLEIVKEFKLMQNYPNPFNPTTTISYYIQNSGNVSLKVYNVLGSLVATIVNGYETRGAKEVSFDGSNLASGIYYYTIETEGFRDTKKMILVK